MTMVDDPLKTLGGDSYERLKDFWSRLVNQLMAIEVGQMQSNWRAIEVELTNDLWQTSFGERVVEPLTNPLTNELWRLNFDDFRRTFEVVRRRLKANERPEVGWRSVGGWQKCQQLADWQLSMSFDLFLEQ